MVVMRHFLDRCRARANHARWRFRYLFYDTSYGLQIKIGMAIVGLMVVVALGGSVMLSMLHPTAQHVQHAYVMAIIALIVAVVAAILAVVLAPKPKAQKPRQNDTPTTEDGQSVRDILGTRWIDDSFILAWKVVGTIPIKGKAK